MENETVAATKPAERAFSKVGAGVVRREWLRYATIIAIRLYSRGIMH